MFALVRSARQTARDAVTRDSKNTSHFSEAADSGDHLHPADGGYKIMGGTVDLRLFKK